MNILLLGKHGQVGHELSQRLSLQGHLTALGRAELDLSDLGAVQKTLDQHKPDFIVNAAAYTAVDKAEDDRALAHRINADAVAILAEYAKHHGTALIHYSTDYVFDGTKQEPYLESDTTNPLNSYGASKLAGEEAIINSGCRGYIFRTSWVFSAQGHNFIKTILKLAQNKDSLSVINDQKGAPTSAELISHVTLLAINAAKQDQLSPGIYHLSAKGQCTWYDLAHYILDKTISQGVHFKLSPSNLKPIRSEEYPLPAKRPKNSLLNSQLLSSALQLDLPDWDFYVDRVLSQLIQMRFLNEA
jgi:dTDP-4-dehydrorhamnose reductase